MNTFCRIWDLKTPQEAADMLDTQRADALAAMRAAGIGAPRNLEQQALALVGRDIYELLIKGYTEKQWGRPCSQLPAFIIRRLPVRMTYDNNYFNDRYQGVPEGGYNRLTDALLSGIDVRLGVDFFDDRARWERIADKIVFTGKIDEFYDYRFGKLDYRTVRFETEVMEMPNYQGNAVVNYTSADVAYTRVIEHKHFELFGDEVYTNPLTVVSREYPSEWREGTEPFYPVNDEHNQAKYSLYKQLANAEQGVIFGGRLAEYRYYDMAPLIAAVFKKIEDEI